MSSERLDKILSNQGYGTRKDVKRLLHSGKVSVNGAVTTDASLHIETDSDVLSVDGEPVVIKKNVYLMMNKPAGTVCSSKGGERQTVFELLAEPYHGNLPGGNLHIVGRLDADTEGLLLLTTDGDFTHRLTSPKTHVAKTYFVNLRDRVDSRQRESYAERFKSGVFIEAEGSEPSCTCSSALLRWHQDEHFPSDMKTASAFLTIFEGKYHQVKRMFSAVGNEVVYLKRVSIGNIPLDEELSPGEYRELTEKEVISLS